MIWHREEALPRRVDTSCTAAEDLLAWARGHAPGLRVGFTRDPATGERAAHARFEYAGEQHELSAAGADCERALARAVHARLLALVTGEPESAAGPSGDRAAAIEREIVAAKLEGRDGDARALRGAYARACSSRCR